MSRNEKQSPEEPVYVRVLKRAKFTVIPFAGFVWLISFLFRLTMNKDAWFWIFTSIAQTFSALVALLAIFIIYRLESNQLESGKKEQAKDLMRVTLPHAILVIMISLILTPFGNVSIKDSWMLDLWVDWKLKWFVVFLVVGLCITTLFKIYSALMNFLGEKEP